MDLADYARLSPDLVLDAIESLGYLTDARVFALNSYENRVYQVGIEEAEPLIAKFYRPNRWSDSQINEEHQFALTLSAQEIPVIAPLAIDGRSLFDYQGYRFALYPRRGGHAPELEDLDTLFTLGQHLGRIHALGKVHPFAARPEISIQSFGHDSRQFVMECGLLPDSLKDAYSTLTEHLLDKIETVVSTIDYTPIRLHGDCHPGNILVRYDHLFIVDLDDARNGPAMQDMWMLLSGDRAQKTSQLSSLIEGYEEFCEFNYAEFALVEPLRALRMMHYCAWLAKRWSDPAFPLAFPWFNTERYWAEHVLELREQLAELDEAPLSLQGF
ncbi:serine/threonine protein kinase [Agarilytica rhodophyticola]|uniref:serine/threonine protein kinase n=1 Tax=Agarilytica rhodophyticola TaxID=1737490 RepID=UPI000B34363C|nr:serine/threonine protein kinase [Agarilytica rhodophyticola]